MKFRDQNGDLGYICTKPNRNTSLESLEACVKLIFADNRKDFEDAYRVAMRGDEGGGVWYYMTTESERAQKAKERYQKNKEYFKEYYKKRYKATIGGKDINNEEFNFE